MKLYYYVINPDNPQIRKEVLAFFDIGSQLSFISKKLSNQLKLRELNPRVMLVASFGTTMPPYYYCSIKRANSKQ
ncbi:unnamed protein product [Onchocerca flexuosa]|uniref:DUF1758 domain-containing protein n=1 Tax=Onchocerca flexuosa TaxID=387005 RepID=A0A183I1W2_9BILA|nr:unnamed protein product [Onchocerca flexuosa]